MGIDLSLTRFFDSCTVDEVAPGSQIDPRAGFRGKSLPANVMHLIALRKRADAPLTRARPEILDL
jgi:hypothetical protein